MSPTLPGLRTLRITLLSLICIVAATSANAQLVGTAAWSGSTSGTPYDGVYLSFRVGPMNNYRSVFAWDWFEASSVGMTFEATVLNDSGFTEVVNKLTNGVEDYACLYIGKSGGSVTLCDLEQFTFGLGRADFQGIPIRRITLEIAQLDISAESIDFDVIIQLWGDGPTLEACPPTLVAPAWGATLDNGCIEESNFIVWDFEWELCEGATDYNLVVREYNAPADFFNVRLDGNSYQRQTVGYISDDHRLHWFWKVRAYVNGVWGDFTEGYFEVERAGVDCQEVATEVTSWGAVKARY